MKTRGAWRQAINPEALEQWRRAALSEPERRALELHEQGLGYGRIGKALGITKASAQDAVRRAKRHLGQGN
jgi:DNA-directed RNA polymerase specialized sigma24 family protein